MNFCEFLSCIRLCKASNYMIFNYYSLNSFILIQTYNFFVSRRIKIDIVRLFTHSSHHKIFYSHVQQHRFTSILCSDANLVCVIHFRRKRKQIKVYMKDLYTSMNNFI